MKKRSVFVVALAAGVVTVGIALPASADPTAASLAVTAGSLSITVPVDAGSLGNRPNSVEGGVISGPLGQVQVNDARSAAAGAGWVASVIATAFTPAPGAAIPATAISYNAGVIAKVGTATYTANNPGSLVGVVPAVTASGITGDNRATWNPTISVNVPGGAVVGVYTATITHSVL